VSRIVHLQLFMADETGSMSGRIRRFEYLIDATRTTSGRVIKS